MNKRIITLLTLLGVIIISQAVSYKTIKDRYTATEKKIKNIENLSSKIKNKYEKNIKSLEQKHIQEISSLNKKLDKTQQEIIIYQTQSTNKIAEVNTPPNSYLERMEILKKENPEEYNKLMEERRRRYSDMKYNTAEKTALIMNEIDTTNMSDEELANHQMLVEKMGKIFEITQQFDDPETGSSREIWRQLGPLIGEVRPMMDLERKVILRQSFTEYLDLSPNEAVEFTKHIEDIIEATTIQMGRRPRSLRNQ